MNKIFFLSLAAFSFFNINSNPIPDGSPMSPYLSCRSEQNQNRVTEEYIKAGCFYISVSQIRQANATKNSDATNSAKNFCLVKSIVIDHKNS